MQPDERSCPQMKTKSYDLIVIGGGAAGSTAARLAARGGRKVALIEREKLGGTCLNYGCDPTKALLHAAQRLHQARNAAPYGLDISTPAFDWDKVLARVEGLISDIRGGSHEDAVANQQRRGIDVYLEEAVFTGPRQVRAGGATLEAPRVLLATGTRPAVPDLPGLREAGFITNEQACLLRPFPERLAILGGGPVGVEFAQIYRRFGAEVLLLEAGPRILLRDDAELAGMLQESLTREGVQFACNATMGGVGVEGGRKRISWKDSSGAKHFDADEILVATGRKPNTDMLQLERAGIACKDGAIQVDACMRTSAEGVFAVGDVTGRFPFTHVASSQAKLVVQNLDRKDPHAFDYHALPWATYTDPALAHVGKTAETLAAEGGGFHTLELEFESVVRAKLEGDTAGKIKLVVDDGGRIQSGAILAPHADELIAAVVVAMRNGVTAGELAETILPYPTRAEGIRWTAAKHKARDSNDNLTPQFCDCPRA